MRKVARIIKKLAGANFDPGLIYIGKNGLAPG